MKHVPNLHKLTIEQVDDILTLALHNAFQIQVQKFSPNRETITNGVLAIAGIIHQDRYRKFNITFREGKHDPFGHDHWEFCYSSMEYYVAIRLGVKEGNFVLAVHEQKSVER